MQHARIGGAENDFGSGATFSNAALMERMIGMTFEGTLPEHRRDESHFGLSLSRSQLLPLVRAVLMNALELASTKGVNLRCRLTEARP